jgi:hypothetical protein
MTTKTKPPPQPPTISSPAKACEDVFRNTLRPLVMRAVERAIAQPPKPNPRSPLPRRVLHIDLSRKATSTRILTKRDAPNFAQFFAPDRLGHYRGDLNLFFALSERVFAQRTNLVRVRVHRGKSVMMWTTADRGRSVCGPGMGR